MGRKVPRTGKKSPEKGKKWKKSPGKNLLRRQECGTNRPPSCSIGTEAVSCRREQYYCQFHFLPSFLALIRAGSCRAAPCRKVACKNCFTWNFRLAWLCLVQRSGEKQICSQKSILTNSQFMFAGMHYIGETCGSFSSCRAYLEEQTCGAGLKSVCFYKHVQNLIKMIMELIQGKFYVHVTYIFCLSEPKYIWCSCKASTD